MQPHHASLTAGSDDAGWYPCPQQPGLLRYFNGQSWTPWTRPEDDLTDASSGAAAAVEHHDGHAPAWQTTAGGYFAERRRRRGRRRRHANLITVAGAVLVLVAAWPLVGTRITGAHQQRTLERQLAAQTSAPAGGPAAFGFGAGPREATSAPTDAPTDAASQDPEPQQSAHDQTVGDDPTLGGGDEQPDGTEPAGRIRIPAIGVDQIVVAGTGEEHLKAGPGWMVGSAALGQAGNTVLSGHRTTYSAPFNRLDELQGGDTIIISVPGQPDAVYEVRATFVVTPDAVQVTAPTVGARLTLTTCHPKGSDRQRFIVQAEQVSGPAADAAVPADRWQPTPH